MNFEIIEGKNTSIALLKDDKVMINDLQDAVDLLGNAYYQRAEIIIINKEQICPEFFNLSSRIAGDILQKFSNYRMQLAIVGDFSKYNSKSLRDFIYESNRGGQVVFVESIDEAKELFSE